MLNEQLTQQLREYAGNSGYSHGDYADTMREAAAEIDRLRAAAAAPAAFDHEGLRADLVRQRDNTETYGPHGGSEAARVAFECAIDALDEYVDAMPAAAAPVVASGEHDPLFVAAKEWWEAHRPASRSEAEHIANPDVNCAGYTESQLAHVVAAMVAAPASPAAPVAPAENANLVLLLSAASGYEARHEYGNITPDQWGDLLRVCEGTLKSAAAPVAQPADERAAKEAAQRERMAEQFKGRTGPATADFDLPAPNDAPLVTLAGEGAVEERIKTLMAEIGMADDTPLWSAMKKLQQYIEGGVQVATPAAPLAQQSEPVGEIDFGEYGKFVRWARNVSDLETGTRLYAGSAPASPVPSDDDLDDGPDMSGIDIPAGDPNGDTLDQLCAAWHREPCGPTLAAIGYAIKELTIIYEQAGEDEIEIMQVANDLLGVGDEGEWVGDINQIIRFARLFREQGRSLAAPASTGPCSDDTAKDAARWRKARNLLITNEFPHNWLRCQSESTTDERMDRFRAAQSAAEQGGKA